MRSVGIRRKSETLAARADRVQQAVGLGGGQHEMNMFRGLLECLEQRVAGRLG